MGAIHSKAIQAALFNDISIPARRLVGPDGKLVLKAANSLDVDYWPNLVGQKRGFLFERSEINLWTHSEYYDSGTVNGIVSSATGHTFTPEIGKLMQRMNELATTGEHETSRNVTMNANDTYTFSCWGRAGTRKHMRLGFYRSGSEQAWMTVDLSTGLFRFNPSLIGTFFTKVAGTIEPWGDGIYRIALVARIGTTGGSVTAKCMICDDTGASGYTGSGGNIDVFGLQCGANFMPGSYIPTGPTAVTRTGTILRFDPRELGWTKNAFTVVWSMVQYNAIEIHDPGHWLIDDGDPSKQNYFHGWANLGNRNIRMNVVEAGVGQYQVGAGGVAPFVSNTPKRIAAVFNKPAGYFQMASGGVAHTPEAISKLPATALTRFSFGVSSAAASNSWIRDLRLYNRALNDAELQAVTALAA